MWKLRSLVDKMLGQVRVMSPESIGEMPCPHFSPGVLAKLLRDV